MEAVKIVNYITGQEIFSKNPKKTVKEILHYHNSVFVRNNEIHFPENAYAEQLGDVIVIKRGKKL